MYLEVCISEAHTCVYVSRLNFYLKTNQNYKRYTKVYRFVIILYNFYFNHTQYCNMYSITKSASELTRWFNSKHNIFYEIIIK